MNLVDSCGWLEYFAGGPNADFFTPVIEDADQLIVPSVCIAEVFKRMLTQRGNIIACRAAVLMRQGLVIDLDWALAQEAATLGNQLGLALADSIILATAQEYSAELWTQDSDFKDLPGVKFREKRLH